MAFDDGLAERLRAELDGAPNVVEKKMFGGLAFRGLPVGGASRARVPRGYEDAPEHALPLLRHEALYAYREHPVGLAQDGRALLEQCGAVWGQLAPLHRWLVRHPQT
jgi:hypothetical protein